MKNKSIKIVPAKITHISGIVRILKQGSLKAKVIKRGRAYVFMNLKNYLVAIDGDKVIGVIGVKVWPGMHPEIISWVVKDEYRRNGIGYSLLEKILEKIKKDGFPVVYTFTGVPDKFRKFGFSEADKRNLPLKMKNDCRFCPDNIGDPNNPLCDETAMKKFL